MNLGKIRAHFDHSYVDGELMIVDLNCGMSVTNDAEAIIAALASTYPDAWPPTFIVYRDSTGMWDGIALNAQGRFEGFYLIGEYSRSGALEAARGLQR